MFEEFAGDPAEFEIIDGNVHCKWGKRPDLCIPLRVFRGNLDRANRVLADYDRGTVIAFPRPKPKRRRTEGE